MGNHSETGTRADRHRMPEPFYVYISFVGGGSMTNLRDPSLDSLAKTYFPLTLGTSFYTEPGDFSNEEDFLVSGYAIAGFHEALALLFFNVGFQTASLYKTFTIFF